MKYIKPYNVTESYNIFNSAELLSAAQYGHTEEVINLIKNGNVNINTQDANGYTPIFLAVIDNHTDIVKILIEAGADPNIPNNFDKYPIIKAASYNYVKTIKELVKAKNINLNIKTSPNGDTPLIIAARDRDCFDSIAEIIKAGADWNITNNDKSTFFDILNKTEQEEIIEMFPEQYKKYIRKQKIKNYNLSFITEKKLDKPEYKKYIITKFYFHNKYFYINLYENLSSKKLLFRYLYYYDKEDNIIKEYIDKHETNYIAFDDIIYQSDNLSDAMKMLEKEVEKINTYKKYRIDK